MKKIFIFTIAAALISLAACTGSNKQGDAKKADSASETKTTASQSKFDDYKKLIEEITPVLRKIAQGDASAMKTYKEMQQKLIALSTGLQTELANNPEKLKEFQDIVQKFQEEAQKIFTPEKPEKNQ